MMKNLLMLLLLTVSTGALAQEEMEVSPDEMIPAESISPDESYEAEMFTQKQEDFITPSFPVDESTEDYMAEEEVYDSESDY